MKLTYVPYYAWNNRGEGEMSVWVNLYIIITYIVMRRYAAIRLHAAFYHAVEKYAVKPQFLLTD